MSDETESKEKIDFSYNLKTYLSFLKNYKLSDDVAFRFSNRDWAEWPLNAEKYGSWISSVNGNGHVVNLFMDYETFGEHQWSDTGIFDFMRQLPYEIYKHPDNSFMTVSEAAHAFPVSDVVDMPQLTSWADIERDLSAWRGNNLQEAALSGIYALEVTVKATNDPILLDIWRKLQTSDHFYYLCTKYWSDGDVHKYFSPYESPYEAYRRYSHAVEDLKLRLATTKSEARLPTEASAKAGSSKSEKAVSKKSPKFSRRSS